MVILDICEGSCYLFYLCNCSDGSDEFVLWSDYINEYYFIHNLKNLWLI